MRPSLILGAVLVCASLTIPTSTATAVGVDCTADLADDGYVYLTDSGATWDINADGSIADGVLLISQRDDAFDNFPYFAIDDGTNGLEVYANPAATCTYEADGRQVALPTSTTAGGLELSRKVYVPATGPGFARFYNQVHNPGSSPATIALYTSTGSLSVNDGDLGSDSTTKVEDSSAGSGVAFVADQLDTAVSWFTTSDDDSDEGDPVLAHNLDAGFARTVSDRVDAVRQEGGADGLRFVYEDVTVPAGGTVAYLSFEAMRPTAAEAGVVARFADGTPPALFAGLSLAEQTATRNWNALDADADGVVTPTDNCPSVANVNQSDIDKDGSGDACDSDADGDGIANDVETAFGTNPLKADTDGDAVKDNADNCPRVAGTAADGCPPATVVVDNVRRASVTRLKVTETKSGPVTIKTKGKVKGKGTATPRDCTHGLASVVVKVGGLAVSHRIVKLKATCTFTSKVTLDQPRRLVKKVKVTGRFLGSDALLPSKKTVKL